MHIKKFCIEVYQDTEESFCLRSEYYLQNISNAPIVNTPVSGTDHVEHAHAFKTQPKYFIAWDDGGKL